MLLSPVSGRADEVTLNADTLTLDTASDSYVARGKVRLLREGVSLMADSVVYNRLTAEATALGAVRLEKGDDLVKGDRLRINLDTQQGELLNGDLFIKKSNFRLLGQRVDKTGDRDYEVHRGTFTTCNGDHPSWRFEARDIKIALDEYATGKDAVFYAGDIPLLYFPYLVFPVQRDRQSGLLLPRIGRSSKKGLYYTQPYYWAIDASQEATFALDLQSSRGVGTAVDYRYLRAHGSEGSLQAYGIYDFQTENPPAQGVNQLSGPAAPGFRGELNQKHLEVFSPDTTFASDLHFLTDRKYYRDFGEVAGEYNRQYLESTLSIDHKWERYNVTGLLSYVEDLVSPNNEQSLQRLPAVNFVGAGEKIGPTFLSLYSGVTNFERGEGTNGQRLVLEPRLSLYSRPASLFDLSLFGGYRQRFYNTYGGDQNGSQGVGVGDAGGAVSLPLERVYNGSVRHVITPSVGYTFVEDKDQDRLPFFDWDDRVLPRNMATWSVTNTITRKEYLESGIPSYRDLVFLRISQGYDFTGARRPGGAGDQNRIPPRDLLTLVDPGHHLTDLMVETRVSPFKDVTFGADGRINPIDGNLSTGNVSATATGEAGNRGTLGYRYSRGQVNYLEGSFTYPIFKPFVASALERYSIDRGAFLESRYALEYRQQCWSLTFSYSDRISDREFMVNFTLSGVGSLGSVRLF
ncbi:LPS-assembly protein LptD [Geomesophilobacter sediminis]|uniref:LPS-assembly protein LptD n=1 Tax=Geomesophilobacter sediminis TaxID=2798584 RepID=A0A8J7S8P2_9BACT|nr:LPS assembly protein LptD [Geomesophilobacter sediminis]MBJ6727672.1 LPS-assembly protein LptD [Geomesophilobacter sediminis]